MKINSIKPEMSNFLQITNNIAYAPKTLYYIGKLPDQRPPVVAIVGSRKPTPYGQAVTYQLAYGLAKYGIIIISGLAIGVDGIAHQAALEAQGTTIAIVAGGLDNIYPRRHRGLAEHIIKQGGVIISEYTVGTPSYPNQFLARNRLISGLSDMVIVTEAAERSGSLSTANHAIDQNREVGAIPGNINNPMSAGTNGLISQGAHLITSTEDVINIIAPQLLTNQTQLPLGLNKTETAILELLKQGVVDSDILSQQSGLTTPEVLQTMTMLEIEGKIRRIDGNKWSIR